MSVIVRGDLNLSPVSTVSVRQGLRKFVEKGLAPGTSGASANGRRRGQLQSFTSDRRQLLAMIDSIKWNPRATAGADSESPPSGFRNTDSLGVGPAVARGNQEVAELVGDMRAFGSVAAMRRTIRCRAASR